MLKEQYETQTHAEASKSAQQPVVMWFGRHEKTPRSGSRVIVKRKISGGLPSNPFHPGHKTGEWEQETVFGGTDFVCDLLSGGYVTEWRYDT